MPMIDLYAAAGTFADKRTLAQDLAAAVMRWEQVPELPLFANNTAAFIHDMDAGAISNVAGDNNYVRVQVLTPIGVLVALVAVSRNYDLEIAGRIILVFFGASLVARAFIPGIGVNSEQEQ